MVEASSRLRRESRAPENNGAMDGEGGPGRKLRVLTLLDVLAPAGGAERLAIRIALELDRTRFEPFVCATRYWRNVGYVDELREAGIPLVQLERRSKLQLRAWARLARLIRR